MIYAGVPSFCGLGLDDGHVPTFWLLLRHKKLHCIRPFLLHCFIFPHIVICYIGSALLQIEGAGIS